MAVSNSSGHSEQASFWRRVFGQLSRYDLLLAVIPLVFALALAAYTLLPIPYHLAVSVGAAANATLLADALYFNAPTAESAEA